MTEKVKQATTSFLAPRTLQITGLVLLVASACFWAFTGRESALLCGAALTLIGVGSYGRAAEELKEIVTNGGSGAGAHERSN